MARLFEKLGAFRQKETSERSGAQGTEWDSLRKVKFAGAESEMGGGTYEEDAARLNAARQQNKIVETMLTGDLNMLVGEVPEQQGRRDAYIDMIAEGQIDEAKERWLLNAIQDPIRRDGPEVMFSTKVVGDKHQMRILGAMTSAGFNGYERTSAQSVQEFMSRYPLPMDFEEDSTAMLEDVREHNSPEKYVQYQEAMERFKHSMYGKRQEYWDQMKILDAEGKERKEGWTIFVGEEEVVKNGNAVQIPRTVQLPRREESLAYESLEVRVDTIGTREQKQILRRTEIDGDAYEQNGNKFYVTPEILKDNGLAPEYSVQMEGAKVNLSKIYEVGARQAVMAYVETERGVKARSYYRSNSQGVWRYLPDYVGTPNGGVDYYGKGINEESTTLPAELQEALAQIEGQQGGNLRITKTVPEFLLVGTAKRYSSRQELWQTLHQGGQPRGDYYQEVRQAPKVVLSAEQMRNEKRPPEQLDVQGGLAPNFEQKVGGWRSKAALYGQVQSEVYRSEDGSLEYVMCENERGQAWVGSVQTTGPVTSTGLRRDWVMAGDICTTPYDYEVQSAGYGDLEDRSAVNMHYVSMWKNYLAKMPIIQKYLQRK